MQRISNMKGFLEILNNILSQLKQQFKISKTSLLVDKGQIYDWYMKFKKPPTFIGLITWLINKTWLVEIKEYVLQLRWK